MKKIYFIIGSQDLYGYKTLAQAEKDGREIAEFLDSKVSVSVEALPIVSGSYEWENKTENGYWTYSLSDIHKGLKDCFQDLSQNVFMNMA